MDLLDRLLTAVDSSGSKPLSVRLTPGQNCFVSLPVDVSYKLYARQRLPLALRLTEVLTQGARTARARHWTVSWAGAPSDARGAVEVPAALAKCIDLPEAVIVTMEPLLEVPAATSVVVEPASTDDWELVEIHAEYMEEQLLNQVGVVTEGQPFPFWVNQAPLFLRVASAEPASLVKLVSGLELAVAPRPRRQPGIGPAGDPIGSADSLLPHKTSWLRLKEDSDEELVALRQASNSAASTSAKNAVLWHTCNTATAWISEQTAVDCALHSGVLVYLGESTKTRQVVARIQASAKAPPAHIVLPKKLLEASGLQKYHATAVREASFVEITPSKLLLHPMKGSGMDSLQTLRLLPQSELQALLVAWIETQKSLSEKAAMNDDKRATAIEDGSIIFLVSGASAAESVLLKAEVHGVGATRLRPGCITVDQISTGKVTVEVGEAPSIQHRLPEDKQPPSKEIGIKPHFDLAWNQKKLAGILPQLLPLLHHPSRALWRKMRVSPPGGLLLCDASGSGVETLAAQLGSMLAAHAEFCVHVVHIRCQEIEIDSLENAKKQLESQIQQAAACAPSLVILESLHVLCPTRTDQTEGQASIGTAALTQWLCEVLDALHEPQDQHLPWPVVFLGTCPSAAEIAEELRAQGRLYHSHEIAAPGSSERESLLKATLASSHITALPAALQRLAEKTDGFDTADLRALADRAAHAAVRRHLSKTPGGLLSVEESDVQEALEGFSPASSWGVSQAGKGISVSGWKDVGGLQEVQEILKATLEIPARFARLMARAPLRLRTGLLLYGPPGCGKTHAISAAIAGAGARFVSVKGPELLNKYIGASEAAVRDVFRQASSAAPCVLFFDEFDAIAPQRGHDSTGVTDRVVNQLLTELDGIEGLKGVSVLAATSRPDLLDAALLRPGRLDRLVYCGLPDRRERLEILRALARTLPLAADADLPSVAGRSEHFTGADLGALLSEAQLAAVHDALESPEHGQPRKDQGVHIRNAHLQTALEKARPSLSARERQRLEAVYNKFKHSREAGLGNKDSKGKQLKATLA